MKWVKGLCDLLKYSKDKSLGTYSRSCYFGSNHPEGFCKKVFLEILQNSQENICVGVSFLKKLQAVALPAENSLVYLSLN